MLRYALICLALSAGAASADTRTFTFHFDTSGAAAALPAGGWLDFQFNQANTDALSAVALLDSLTYSPDYTLGPLQDTSPGVTLGPPVSIPNDAGGANWFTQEITTWGSAVDLTVTLTGPALGASAPSGSDLYVTILDPGYVPLEPLLDLRITTSGDAVVVPEPAAAVLLFTVLAGVFFSLRLRASAVK